MAEPAGHASPIPCCIAGGGPAGMMLGYLLARAGVRTVVLEKHADFLRDFRGDTVHPSTLRIMDELGLLDEFLQRPHQKLEVIGGWFGDQHVQLGDFRGLPARYAFIAMMPQWEFLDFIADEARKLPTFTLAHARQRHRPDRGSGAASSACAAPRPTATSRSAPTSPSAATAAIRPCAPVPGSPSRTSARRSTCSGFASGAIRPSSTTAWRGSRPATSSSPSTAATTGNARS